MRQPPVNEPRLGNWFGGKPRDGWYERGATEIDAYHVLMATSNHTVTIYHNPN